MDKKHITLFTKKLSSEQKKLIEALAKTDLDDTVIEKFDKFTKKNDK